MYKQNTGLPNLKDHHHRKSTARGLPYLMFPSVCFKNVFSLLLPYKLHKTVTMLNVVWGQAESTLECTTLETE